MFIYIRTYVVVGKANNTTHILHNTETRILLLTKPMNCEFTT